MIRQKGERQVRKLHTITESGHALQSEVLALRASLSQLQQLSISAKTFLSY